MEKIELKEQTLASIIKLTIPMLFAFFPIGLGFGLYGTQLGFSPLVVTLMSFLVYAGSSEFLAISMMATGETITQVLLSGFLVNLRHVFYGLSVFDNLPKNRWLKFYTVTTLSDETYALLASTKLNNKMHAVLIAALLHFYWFVSVGLGAFIGGAASFKIKGVEFVLAALFVVLMIEQYKQIRKVEPFLFGIIGCGLGALVSEQSILAVAMGFCLMAFTARYRFDLKREKGYGFGLSN